MPSKILVFTALVVFVNGYNDYEIRRPPADTGRNVMQLIKRNGYPFENHTVQTKDGYILEVHRIPHGRNTIGNDTRPPVLLVAGYFCGSADWVNFGPENSLGFILADEGYDVWLANYRGTRWSRKHAWLDPDVDRKEYWTFSFQQIGQYDVPAFIDYILSQTNQEKLFYIGHSQGTTSFFALTSEEPEYNKKVRLSIALSPVAYAGHMKSALAHLFAIFEDQIAESLEKNQRYEVFPHNPRLALIGRLFCQDGAATQDLCGLVFYAFAGYSNYLNKTMIPVIATNTPAGSSMVQALHYGQLLKSKKFRKYDYGEDKNLEIYGQSTPPDYDLRKITTPIAMYYGDKDPFTSKEDADRLASEVLHVAVRKIIDGYSHLDTMWGIGAQQLIFKDIIELMKQY
ncbi:hypothetical protein ILUMI_12940 [Ignelater luminosus]|uniref:Lipase n=1 Tax=Ignelater luminosus TaxID=2038154 RepID=A0A8K0GBW0_IGNLU|nr:hypothetical protein ILUMI_12940 [Ignelater luminosus]